MQKILREYFRLTHDMICGYCNEQIKDDEKFHIDHEIPWMSADDPMECYIDLENIRPAHVHCNCKNVKHYNINDGDAKMQAKQRRVQSRSLVMNNMKRRAEARLAMGLGVDHERERKLQSERVRKRISSRKYREKKKLEAQGDE
jgi:hypothetical protein